MARVVAIGQPENESERHAIAFLRDSLSDAFRIIHNFEIRQGAELFEIDVAILGPQCLFVVDVKGTHGLVDVYGSKWYPEGRAPYHSPLAILRKHAKTLKTIICDHDRSNGALRQIYVDAAVILTSPDAILVDPEGRDLPHVTPLNKSASFFQGLDRIPANFTRDIRQSLGTVERAIVGKAKPKSAPPCYGNWQIEEKLGGNDRYTEFRARHVILGDRRGGSARLRVYQVDPYLSPDERRRQQNKISNAFRAVANLPGHPNILTVREFFETESKDRYVLVTEDVAGHALRQHIKKPSLALTYDQKICIIRDTLAALDHAHRSDPQVVHRNLTPDAVLVTSSGRGILTAFDYARAGSERTSSSIADQIVDDLEPMYQAPECYRDPAKASVLSDLYSAGFVFFELLVGEPPFSSIDDMMERDGRFPMVPSQIKPELPAALDDWLQALCAFDTEDRFASAAVARDKFNQIVGPDPREAGNLRSADPATKPSPAPAIDYSDLSKGVELVRRFTVEERLGRPGGFAVAYKVFDSFSDTSRVLKLVIKDRRSTFERLKQEYKALLSLKPHPNVVKVEWADQLPDETPYMVFEYIPGLNVEELIDAKAVSLEDALKIAKETAIGLQYLHSNGLFHRDIKPSNLLWTDGGVKIIDFNVAVREDETNERQGGTRRYLPPDLDLDEVASPDQEADRDLFAFGITVFECATNGRYPWSEPRPSSLAPQLADAYVPEISNEFSALIRKAVAPRRSERFGSATEFIAALDQITSPRIPAHIVRLLPEEGIVNAVGLGLPKPNFNPFVLQLMSMYSQSRGNAGTRGLDDVSKATYVSTLLDTKLKPAVLEGTFGLVVISGNAGDGKTAFIQQLEGDESLRGAVEPKVNGASFDYRGRRFLTNYDGSQDEESKINDDVLKEFFAPYRGDDDRSWPKKETRIIAINEGRLVDFLTQHEADYPHVGRILRSGLAGDPPSSGVLVVNLNLRTIVAGSDSQESIFDRLLKRLTTPSFWEPCGSCDLREKCYIYHNVQTLQDKVAGPKVAERLRTLYQISHLRGRLHITMRDLRSALSYTIAGIRDCDDVHRLYENGTDEARSEILNGFYFNSWRGPNDSKDRLLSLLQEIDVGEASNPDLDRALDYVGPEASDASRLSFPTRSGYDQPLLEKTFRRLPREVSAGAAPERMKSHREYVSMVRRRHYFERRDETWKEMLPYSTALEFWDLVTGTAPISSLVPGIISALNRGEGLSDPTRLGNSLVMRMRVVERGTLRSYRLFSGSDFSLRVPSSSDQNFLEHTPQAIALVYRRAGREIADLLINLDIYEMFKRLNAGYRPSLEELQGYYLSLSVFKNVLGSAPYQEVLVTRTGYEFFRIRRDATARLHLEPVLLEVRAQS